MTNREKALKLINEYLAKQEPQKVELALIDNIEQAYKEMKSLASELYQDRDKSIDAVRRYKNKTVRVKQYSIDMINSYDRFEKAANELGVEIPNNLQKKAKEAEDLKKRTTKLQSMISSTLKSL